MTISLSLLDDVERYLIDPTARNDPYPLYERLHVEAPVLRTRSAMLIFSRYRDVRTILTSDAFGVDLKSAAVGSFVASPDDHRHLMMSFQDPPEHTRLRRLVARHFTSNAAEQYRSAVVDLVRRTLPYDDADFELVGGFAHELPINVTCTILGIPETEFRLVRHWTDSMSRHLEMMGHHPDNPHAVAEQRAFAAYAIGLVAGTEGPRGPLQALRSAFLSGQLDAAQLTAYVMLLLIAGRETVTNMVGTSVLTLLRHPDQAEMLRARPDQIPKALDECLRYESPVHLLARIAQRATTVGGVEIDRGEIVLALVGAGNRDEEIFPDPSRFDIARDAHAHLGFGAGAHYCLGASLARIEGEVVLAELFAGRRWITPQCDLNSPAWRDSLPFRGPAELRIGLTDG